MIRIKGLSKDKYIELVQKARKFSYRYSTEIRYDSLTEGYDITFTPEISVYASTSFKDDITRVQLLALGQLFITLKTQEYVCLEIL